MNKFAAIVLSACLLSGSSSWSMGQAIENFVKNNPARCFKAALLIGVPLAYGTVNYISALKKSTNSKKLIEKFVGKSIIGNHECYEEAFQLYQDLTLKENTLKFTFVEGYVIGGCASALSMLFGARDPITIAGVGIITAVTNVMGHVRELNYITDLCDICYQYERFIDLELV